MVEIDLRTQRIGEILVGKNLITNDQLEETLAIQKKKPWVVSVLWDNAGVGRFNEDFY